MVIITNHRVQDNDISDGQTVDELEEFQTEYTRIGIPGIPDAGTSALLAFIEKVNLWIHNIREKKSSKGDDRRERQHLEKKFKAIVTHRNSDEYIIASKALERNSEGQQVLEVSMRITFPNFSCDTKKQGDVYAMKLRNSRCG